MLEQITYTTNNGAIGGFLALLFFALWVTLVIVFIQMAINVGKIRRMMEQDRGGPPRPYPGEPR